MEARTVAESRTILSQVMVSATLRASVNDVGHTSLEVGVRVEAENVRMADVKHVASAYLVYVALDDAGTPTTVPPLRVETDEEHRRQHAARERRAAHSRTSAS